MTSLAFEGVGFRIVMAAAENASATVVLATWTRTRPIPTPADAKTANNA